jgi:hypothetical protein
MSTQQLDGIAEESLRNPDDSRPADQPYQRYVMHTINATH